MRPLRFFVVAGEASGDLHASNLIKAIRFVAGFIQVSATRMNIGDKIPDVSPFRLDQDSRGQPSSFEMTVSIDGVLYCYGFSASAERVHDEWLHAYPKGRAQKWLERELNPKTGNHSVTGGIS